MKLEVGKYYKTRDGRKARIASLDEGTGWFKGNILDGRFPDDNFHFFFDGANIGNEDYFRWADLIAEWTDAPTTGTLAEIGAKVGDVVEFEGCNRYLIVSICNGKYKADSLQTSLKNAVLTDRAKYWRIVSRASDAKPTGPVITETVTTKRIVPGVYGPVVIEESPFGLFASTSVRCDDRAELTEARGILSQLIDAMPKE